jgi:hypothetical protein
VIGGVLGTFVGWRPAFGILIVLSALVFLLSFRLKPDHGRPDVAIDVVGVVLAAAAIILISFGFNNLNRWGLGLARLGAPFDIFGLDATAAGGWQDSAACPRCHRIARGAGCRLCDVHGRRP